MARNRTLTVTILGDANSALRAFAKTDKAAETLGGRLGHFAGVAAASMGVAAVAGVAALVKIGVTMDNARDTIRIATGETGAALDGLIEDFEAVGAQVPDKLDVVASTLAELHQRTGQTGDGLRQLTETSLDLARITKEDVNAQVAATTRLFGAWNVETQDQTKTLDLLLRAQQASGIAVTDLATSVVDFGAPLQQLGFSLEESVALFASFERGGVNTEKVVAGLRAGLARLAKTGEEPIVALQRITNEIKNAGTTAEANQLAVEAFGSRAGPEMAAAIRSGRFELDAFVATIANGTDTVADATAETEDYTERLKQLGNQLQIGLAPAADAVFTSIGRIVEALVPALTQLAEKLGPALSEAVEKIAPLMEDLAPVIADVAGQLVDLFLVALDAALPLIEDLLPLIEALAEVFSDVVVPAVKAAIAVVKPFISIIGGAVDVVTGFVNALPGVGPSIADTLAQAAAAELGLRAAQTAQLTAASAATAAAEAEDRALRQAAFGAQELTAASEDTTEAVEPMTGSIEELNAELEDAIENQESLADVLRRQADPVFNAIRAWEDYQATLADVNADGQLTNDEIVDLTKAGLDLQVAIDGVDAGGIEAFRQAVQAETGLSIEAVDALLQQLNILDGKQIKAHITVTGPREVRVTEISPGVFGFKGAGGTVGLAQGGVTQLNRPIDAAIGEGADQEAIIPLNSRGVSVIASAIKAAGGIGVDSSRIDSIGSQAPVIVQVVLNDKVIAEAIAEPVEQAQKRLKLRRGR